MLQIYSPYCGEVRSEDEFHYAGEAHIIRPVDPEALTDEEWGRYLFHRKNIKGLHYEMWYHATESRKFFNAARNTVTYQIERTYKMGESQTGENQAGENQAGENQVGESKTSEIKTGTSTANTGGEE